MKEKKLVAIFTNNDDDIYCFRKELIESIIDAGYDVLISCPYGEKFELMQHIEYIYDNPEIDRRGTNIVADGKLFLHYLKLLKKYKPDVVLTYTAKPNVYCGLAAHLLRIPVIANVTGFGSAFMNSKVLEVFVTSLLKLVFRRNSCVMFQNSTNKAFAESKGMVKGNSKLIPGSGVNVDKFFLMPYPDGGNGIDGSPVVFNYIGRILHDKGVDDFIEAAKYIKKKYPLTQFNMIGFIEPTEIHYEKTLEELSKENIIHYYGNQKDVRDFIKISHATILPSYGEGMSNALLESGSCGRPLISTDNQGCRETFIDNVTGFMYHSADVNDLIRKIELFLSVPNQERKVMGEKGREYIKEHFSREIVVSEYLKMINELI